MQAKAATGVPGQGRALWMSTIAFTVCFAVWTIFAIIGVQIKDQLGLNETQFGLLVGTPILTGSLARCIQHEIDHLDGILFTDRLTHASTLRRVAELTDDEVEMVGGEVVPS